jgi:hypothetical protein
MAYEPIAKKKGLMGAIEEKKNPRDPSGFFFAYAKKLLNFPLKEKLTTAVNLTYVKLTAFSRREKRSC